MNFSVHFAWYTVSSLREARVHDVVKQYRGKFAILDTRPLIQRMLVIQFKDSKTAIFISEN